mgnify:CR=1 FL=1
MLFRSLRGNPSGRSTVSWTAEMSQAFTDSKQALASTAVLDHPAAGAEISLVTDASSSHLGAVLQQRRRGGQWRPLGFFSHKLSVTEANYSAFDRELLAVYASIIHFQHMLEGRQFTVFTDHRPLLGALTKVADMKSDRQRRQLSFISEFALQIRHISGESNVVADTLSRPSSAASDQRGPVARDTDLALGLHHLSAVSGPATPPPQPPVDVADIAAAQPSCADCQRARVSPSLRVQEVEVAGTKVLVETSSGVFRLLVPQQFRRQIF